MELKQGDCLELMKELPDSSIDLILCDLPYGITSNNWDAKISLNLLWKEYERIIKDNGVIALTASQPFTSILVISNLKIFRYEWIWIKNKGGSFFLSKKMPRKEHESICIFYKKQPTYNPIMQERTEGGLDRVKYKINASTTSANYGNSKTTNQYLSDQRYPSSWQKFNTETGLHPTQKPIALFEYLIKTYTNQGDVVLDNCMGSGTTGVACVQLNRNFIGYELSPEYFKIAEKRINEALMQNKL